MRAIILAAAALAATPPAGARIVSVEIEASEPFFGGYDFGSGPCLHVSGVARRELAPAVRRSCQY